MALADFGSPAADAAKPALLEGARRGRQRRQAADLLGARGAQGAERVRHRHGRVPPRAPRHDQRLDGYPGVRPRAARRAGARSTSSRRMAGDESDSVRQLVATTLSQERRLRSGPTRSSSSSATSRSRSRARPPSASARSATTKATQPLVDALNKADKDSREKFLAGAARRHRRQRPRARAQDGAAHARPRARSSRPSRSST